MNYFVCCPKDLFSQGAHKILKLIYVVRSCLATLYRSERTLEKMESLLPPNCTVEREGEPGVVFAKYLVPGDIVHLSMGDRVPADLRLFQANQVSVDESSLTGESDPIAKDDAKIESSSEKSLDVSSMRNICFQVGQCGLELHPMPSWDRKTIGPLTL